MFMLALEDYPFPLVKSAFKYYIKNYREFPAPSDIVQIIEQDNGRLLGFLSHVKNGGNLTDFAIEYVENKLGKNWRGYV